MKNFVELKYTELQSINGGDEGLCKAAGRAFARLLKKHPIPLAGYKKFIM